MCYNITIEDLIKGGCSHGRANEYFQESVRAIVSGDQFVAQRCSNWDDFKEGLCCDEPEALMGELVDIR